MTHLQTSVSALRKQIKDKQDELAKRQLGATESPPRPTRPAPPPPRQQVTPFQTSRDGMWTDLLIPDTAQAFTVTQPVTGPFLLPANTNPFSDLFQAPPATSHNALAPPAPVSSSASGNVSSGFSDLFSDLSISAFSSRPASNSVSLDPSSTHCIPSRPAPPIPAQLPKPTQGKSINPDLLLIDFS